MNAPPPKPESGKSRRDAPLILLVDDEPLVVDVQKRIIERSGFTCLSASSAAEADDLLRAHREIDLLILDAILPDARGAPLLRRLKRLAPSAKVIVCSGMREEGSAEEILDAGADGFLSKPFPAAALLGQIRSVLTLPV